jgi:uncharacterized protein (TIGR02058 family)
VLVTVTIAVSRPEDVIHSKITECLPIGKVDVKIVKGGLNVPGLLVKEFGDKNDSIEAAIACVEVAID